MENFPIPVRFYVSEGSREPVREWLKILGRPDSMIIGKGIGKLQFGWPVGMPVCRALSDGLYEVRSALSGNRIARVLFFFHEGEIVLLHGFIKKTRKTPEQNIRLALERKKRYTEMKKQ